MILINNHEHGIGKEIIIDTERLNYRCVKRSKPVKYILRDLKVYMDYWKAVIQAEQKTAPAWEQL